MCHDACDLPTIARSRNQVAPEVVASGNISTLGILEPKFVGIPNIEILRFQRISSKWHPMAVLWSLPPFTCFKPFKYVIHMIKFINT